MNKLHRITLLIAAIIGLSSFFIGSPNELRPAVAHAGALSNLSVAVSNTAASAASTYTINFTPSTTIPVSGGYIYVLLAGTTTNNSTNGTANFNGYTINTTSSSPSALKHLSYVNYTFATGVTLGTDTQINAGTPVTIVLDNVTNPGRSGYYSVHAWTTQYGTPLDGDSNFGGDYYSSYVSIGSGTNVSGKITAADGSPVGGAHVSIHGSNWVESNVAYTDKNGDYGMYVAPGTYTYTIAFPFSNSTSKTYIPPADVEITIPSTGTITKNASFVAQTKTLTGKLTRDSSSGNPIADATINAYKSSGSGWSTTTTDSSGNYSFKLSGGNWLLSYYPKNYPANWAASTVNESVAFADDNSTESVTRNFIGLSVDATVKGRVVKPDGSSPASGSVGFSFSGANGTYTTYSATVDGNGNFTSMVARGSYSASGWVTDGSLVVPAIENFSIGQGETKDLGTITLLAKNESIIGKITDSQGNPVSGASVNAWKNNGTYEWSNTVTDSNGRYTLKVTPGSWQVSAWPPANSNSVYSGQPKNVTVTAGIVANQDFNFQLATNTINGTVVDPDGKAITNQNLWVNASDGSQGYSNIGASVINGSFTLKVPKGKWTISTYFNSTDFGTPDPVIVSFDGNDQAQTITLKATRNDATIKGTIYDADGNKVTGKNLSVWATKGQYGAWQQASINQSDGTYSIKVSAGRWSLGWWIDPNLGYSSSAGQALEIDIVSGETKSYDIKLRKADSTITGKVTKEGGNPFSGVWVTADSRDPNTKTDSNSIYFNNGTSTANDGTYTLKVPSGSYFVGGNIWFGSGYINPKRQKITVESGKTVTVDLNFGKADASITGKVTKDGTGVSAYVTTYSEDGGYAEGQSNNEGDYQLNASSKVKWHVRAIKMEGKEVYRSKEAIVEIDPAKEPKTISADLNLTKQNFTLPSTQTVSFDPTVQQSIKLDDGTTLIIPANVVAASGTVTVTVEPDANLASESGTKPLAYGYNFKLIDQNGKDITKFNGNVTIKFKYQKNWLTENKVTDNEVSTAFYDTAAGTWLPLTQCTVDTEEMALVCQTDHFTKFALVAASDTTPPSAPANPAASFDTNKIHLSWTNPTDSDFASVTIYRSEESGKLGDSLTSSASGTTYDDTNGLVANKTFYYTVKAVDKSGNESINTNQVSALSKTTTASSTLPKTGLPNNQVIPTAFLGIGLLFARLFKTRLFNSQPKIRK